MFNLPPLTARLILVTLLLLPAFAQSPEYRLHVEELPDRRVRLAWPQELANGILEETVTLNNGILWQDSPQTPVIQGSSLVVTLEPTGTGRYFRLRLPGTLQLTRIIGSSPSVGDEEVAVTRETILYFSEPLAADATITRDQFSATVGNRKILSRVELATDRRKATLFYLENLPASSRVQVTLNTDQIKDDRGRTLDGNNDGIPGGTYSLAFNTLSTTPVSQTAVIGRVFASEQVPNPATPGTMMNVPLQGVTVTVDGAEETMRTTTDATGFFKLQPVPSGRFFVHVDGRTAQGSSWPNGDYYPVVGKAWEAVAGVETNLAGGNGEIFLPLVIQGTLTTVSATTATQVTFPAEVIAANPELAGVSVTVPANSLFNDAGTRGGRVGIAPVPPDRIPEPLPPGLNLPLVITIQTDGPSNFDRPVPVRFPNLPDPVSGLKLPPGAKSALWSFNHDTGRWEIAGPMTVTADGNFVETDPGYGVLQPGWHGTQPGSGGGCDAIGGGGGGDTGGGTNGGDGGDGDGNGPGGGDGPSDEGGDGDSGGPDGDSGDDGGDGEDTDGDGESNNADDDIDGDGIKNDADPDIDGDGRNNTTDNDDDDDGVRDEHDSSPSGGGGGTGNCAGGVDCGCPNDGGYVDPEVVTATVNADGTSPNGRYRLTATQQGADINIVIRRVSNNGQVISVTIPSLNAGWGFAPDGDSFMYNFITGGFGNQLHTLMLHNLARQNPSVPVWTIQKAATPSGFGYSPHGRRFVYASVLGTQLELYVISTSNGDVAHFTSFPTGNAGWGFSPDCSDRSFIYAYGFGGGVQWNLVNLDKKKIVNTQLITAQFGFSGASGSWSFNPLSGFWQFSPCGDKAGLVISSGGFINVQIIPTRDVGLPIFSTQLPVAATSLRVTSQSHIARQGGTDTVLGANNADDACNGSNGSLMRAAATGTDLPPEEPLVFSTGLHYYALKDWTRAEIVQRGVAGRAGIAHANLIMRPNTPYRNYILKADTLEVGYADFISGDNGRNIILPNVYLIADGSDDTDGDGLGSIGELIMGTSPTKADTDNDGINDGNEIRQGLDPNSGLAVRTGVIAAVNTPGTAVDVSAFNDIAAVADRDAGVALFDVSAGLTPNLLRQLDTPGSAESVAVGDGFVAVADGPGGLAIINIIDPPNATLLHQVNIAGNARAVAVSGAVAYVGTQAGQVVVVDMVTGTILERHTINEVIHDLVVTRGYLYVQLPGSLRRYRLVDDTLELAGQVTLSFFAEGITGRRRLFVGEQYAYVTSYPGYHVIDVSNPDTLVVRGNAVDAGANSHKQVIDNGSALGVAAVGINPRDDGTHDIYLFDLDDPTVTGTLLATLPTPGIAHALSIYNGLAYVADGAAGLQVVNYLAYDASGVPPTIALSASFPLNPPQAEEGKRVRLSATVTDDVQVRNVEFYIDGELVAIDGNYPFEANFITPVLPAPNFKLRAKATDTGGNFTWTDEITVALVPDATPPRVVRRFPSSGAIVGEAHYVSAQFSEPINQGTLSPATFLLRFGGVDNIIGNTDDSILATGVLSYREDVSVGRIDFDETLAPGLYQVSVRPPLADLSGNPLAADVVWNFWVLGQADSDNDGVPDNVEAALNLDPQNPDSDGDNILDGDEDFDSDRLKTSWELVFGYDPRVRDSDQNGVNDDLEDSDNDGLNNFAEAANRTSPRTHDSDGDGWDDNGEVLEGTDPANSGSEPTVLVSSESVSFLNATPATLPAGLPKIVTSSTASFLNGVAVPLPQNLVRHVQSPVVSYLNALAQPVSAGISMDIISPAASYLNAVPEDEPATVQTFSPIVSYQNQ